MILLYTTFPNEKVAREICSQLVNKDLVKCVNIINNGFSIYKWEGKFAEEAEVYAYLKTTAEKFAETEDFIKKNHPYTTPCLLEIKLNHISPEYKEWVES